MEQQENFFADANGLNNNYNDADATSQIEAVREKDGLEDEGNNDEAGVIQEPFDPKKIVVKSKGISLDNLMKRLQKNTLILSPDFQRHEVWNTTKKSQLIESLMLNIPLPMFYFAEDEDDKLTVIDGLQRLSAIRDFLNKPLNKRSKGRPKKGEVVLPRVEPMVLQNLEFLKELEGRTFEELPLVFQERIRETEVRATIIGAGTPEEVKLNIFRRINTGGEPLSTQEIRNALYLGRATQLLNELASSEEFRVATGDKVKSQRMQDRELVLRLLVFFVRHYSNLNSGKSANTLMSETMLIINSAPDFNRKDYRALVEGSKYVDESAIRKDLIPQLKDLAINGMGRAYDLLGEHCFRRSFTPDMEQPVTKSAINKALFEMWTYLLGMMNEDEYEQLYQNRERLYQLYYEQLQDEDFGQAISRDSMKRYVLPQRFETINAIINACK